MTSNANFGIWLLLQFLCFSMPFLENAATIWFAISNWVVSAYAETKLVLMRQDETLVLAFLLRLLCIQLLMQFMNLVYHGTVTLVYIKCHNLYLQLIYLYLQLLHITSSPPNMESNRDGTATDYSNYLPSVEIRREPTPPDTIVNANNYVHNNGNVPLHLCRHVIMQLLQLGTGFTGHR